jgi:hypothetical protein
VGILKLTSFDLVILFLDVIWRAYDPVASIQDSKKIYFVIIRFVFREANG